MECGAVAKRRHALGRYPVPVVDKALGSGDPLDDGQVRRGARLVAAEDQDSLVTVGVGDPQDRQARPRIGGHAGDAVGERR